MSNRLYIVMPAYNEEENIEKTVREWHECLAMADEGSKLIIADSGSMDRTHEILTRLCDEYDDIEIMSDTARFHGAKLIALYKYAVAQGADYIFQTDSDGQTSPAEFGAFWNDREANDAIVGCRPVRGDGMARKLVERVLCVLLYIYYGVRIPDANAPFRLMSRSLLEQYIERFDDEYNLPNVMLTTFWVYDSRQICFRDISFAPRQGGASSINFTRIACIGWKSLRDFKNFKKMYGLRRTR